ncbi:Radical SAM family enzyme, similar to coproporphyrinogen III oxidase, oxygen-independent,clustered with nucleoside-triphosphatase RdgB [Asaia bogorensis]|uniref:Heme chaperone HemW n=1 Tax=Asaia bogorensis TaxID=91915 RepID=A0A060QJE3_9PROT|nr:coproporphyrinogen III oxidase [Asaia sp. SF2.1]CDG41274.1 Radical SAM family enzyme, similar to coproporphyrinogen III oxidase, oxygen-independent,clustered with nucleoside-triphosphatase RdgB [Asaia bogorensis]
MHWPFCLAKCPYCDFNSHVRDVIPHERFTAALRQELAHDAARTGRRSLRSIFFGGGTPSLMRPETVALIIQDALHHFDAAPDLEITLEANPTSVEREKLAGFAQAGVNRISLGIQSLNEDSLRFLGREHSAGQAVQALETARTLFPRLSFDLIYARPGQSLGAWEAELREALALASDHLSLYQLTIEQGTKFEALYRQGRFTLPEGDEAARLYEKTAEIAGLFGMRDYEISNYARPGAESRHNLTYWRYQDYIGIGPGAHGRLTLDDTLLATRRHRAPEIWADRVEQRGSGSTEETPLSSEERGREALLMGLRLREGIDLDWFAKRTGRQLAECVDPMIFEAAQEENYLSLQDNRLIATDEGRVRLEALLGALVL